MNDKNCDRSIAEKRKDLELQIPEVIPAQVR